MKFDDFDFFEGTVELENVAIPPPKFNEGDLIWVPRLRCSAIVVDRNEELSKMGQHNYWCVTIKGIQWISEEYLEPFDSCWEMVKPKTIDVIKFDITI